MRPPLHVDEEADGLPLATALKFLAPELSWGEAKRRIATRRATVNGNLCLDAQRPVRRGDVLRLLDEPVAPPPTAGRLVLRHVDRDLVVVEKPAGLTSTRHAGERSLPQKRKQLQPTLDELLPIALAKHLARPGGHPLAARKAARPDAPPARLPPVRAVHRLDRDTSGLMVFARTPDAERGLVRLFARHEVERAYTAFVVGELREARTIESWLAKEGDKRGSVPQRTEGAQRAVTHVEPVETKAGVTRVRCRLETGRTHQIRIHLSEAGHPVCGDKLYRSQGVADRTRAPRQALHAGVLGFAHPDTGETLRWEMELAGDLARWWARLSGSDPDPQGPA